MSTTTAACCKASCGCEGGCAKKAEPQQAGPIEGLNIAEIRKASERMLGKIERTPCINCPGIADLIGASKVYVKMEVLQRTGAFKERGALNKLLSLSEKEKAAGVVTASAGNHGQGVAYHSKRLGIKATVCMPVTTPLVKVDRVRSFGAEVCKIGESFEQARAHAYSLVDTQKMTMVHPYDDPVVMCGQGTIALEMLEQCPDIDTMVVQIGGGGLAAGMFTAARAVRPDVALISAQTQMFASYPNKVDGKTPVAGAATIADGIAVVVAGDRTTEALKNLGVKSSETILVTESMVERAILMLLKEARAVVEGAGATGLAALLTKPERFAGKRVGIVLSGGNIDPLVLAEVVQRGLARQGSISRLTIDVPDRPGALAKAATLVGTQGANILEVAHQRTFCSDLDVKHTRIVMTVETEGSAHSNRVAENLTASGFKCTIVALNEAHTTTA